MECVTDFSSHVIQQWPTLVVPCLVVMLNPLFWNLWSRIEYKTKLLSNTFGGPKQGSTALAIGILSMNCLRTTVFFNTIVANNSCSQLKTDGYMVLGSLLVVIGFTFVLSSGFRLGFFGTFNGDSFGILHKSRITGFPFNVLDDPMYVGSTIVYIGLSFLQASLFGFLLTFFIATSYGIATFFEGPFTAKIYSNAALKAKAKPQ